MMIQPIPVRHHSILDTSLKLDGIIEILRVFQKHPTWFAQMCRESRIKFRKANLKYLKYCRDKGLVDGVETELKIRIGRGYSRKARGIMVYSLSEKGKLFLELVS